MNYNRKTISKSSIEWANSSNKEAIKYFTELASQYAKDLDKKSRKADNQCKKCYYGQKVATQAFTDRQCGLCDTTCKSNNGRCPVLCDKCSNKLGLCKYCGADQEYVNRRNRELPEPTEMKEK